MLRPVRLALQFREIETRLPEGWTEARFSLAIADPALLDRAAALLGPVGAGRSGSTLRFQASRAGHGARPAGILRLLERADAERIEGTLTLLESGAPAATEAPAQAGLVVSWESALAALPADWTDLFAAVHLDSTDYLDRAALLVSPLNPRRTGPTSMRFRIARRFGYGASPEMARRAFERADEAGIRGRVEVLHVFSDTSPVSTQGPVLYSGGPV
jgi:hypothetical protein